MVNIADIVGGLYIDRVNGSHACVAGPRRQQNKF